MSSDAERRPPAPVLVVVALYALVTAVLVVGAVVAAIGVHPALLLLGVAGLMPGSVAFGLWQGNRGARFVAVFFALPSLFGWIVVLLLLGGPESSRAWFTPDEPDDGFAFLYEDGDDADDTDDTDDADDADDADSDAAGGGGADGRRAERK